MTQGLGTLIKLMFNLCFVCIVCEIRAVDDMVSKGSFNDSILVFLFQEILGED